jgi:hypothetical protein
MHKLQIFVPWYPLIVRGQLSSEMSAANTYYNEVINRTVYLFPWKCFVVPQ